jgi:hypothetical protein
MTSTSTSTSTFYPTATAVLLALLITWLVAEAREMGAVTPESEGNNRSSRRGNRLHGSVVIFFTIALSAGIVVSLRVQFRGAADRWESTLLWAVILLGFASVASSLIQLVYTGVSPSRWWNPTTTLRIGRIVFPLVVAGIAGILASPLVRHDVTGARFTVYGTCAAGGCGLKQRRGPGPGYPEVPGMRLADGTRVLVVCQARGRRVPRFGTRVWDQLDGGNFVSDAFVDTPNRHGFSSELDRCERSSG